MPEPMSSWHVLTTVTRAYQQSSKVAAQSYFTHAYRANPEKWLQNVPGIVVGFCLGILSAAVSEELDGADVMARSCESSKFQKFHPNKSLDFGELMWPRCSTQRSRAVSMRIWNVPQTLKLKSFTPESIASWVIIVAGWSQLFTTCK